MRRECRQWGRLNQASFNGETRLNQARVEDVCLPLLLASDVRTLDNCGRHNPSRLDLTDAQWIRRPRIEWAYLKAKDHELTIAPLCGFIFCRAEFNREVLTLDEASLLQAIAERGHEMRHINERCTAEKPNHRDRWLLRACRERPRRRAAEHGDEFPPPHVRSPQPEDCTLPDRCRKCRVVHHSKFARTMSLVGLGRVKTREHFLFGFNRWDFELMIFAKRVATRSMEKIILSSS
jgi:hypothetical protein